MLPFGSSSFGQLEGSQDYAAAPSQLPCLVFFLWPVGRIAGLRRSPFTTAFFCFVASVKDRRTTPQPLHTAFLLDHKASEDAEARSVESSEVKSS